MTDTVKPIPLSISLLDVSVYTTDDGDRRLHLSPSVPDYIPKQVFELDEATLLSLLKILREGKE